MSSAGPVDLVGAPDREAGVAGVPPRVPVAIFLQRMRGAGAPVASFADVTAQDQNLSNTLFEDGARGPLLIYSVTGVSPRGESPWGHYGR